MSIELENGASLTYVKEAPGTSPRAALKAGPGACG
jgi:hypothetical protein